MGSPFPSQFEKLAAAEPVFHPAPDETNTNNNANNSTNNASEAPNTTNDAEMTRRLRKAWAAHNMSAPVKAQLLRAMLDSHRRTGKVEPVKHDELKEFEKVYVGKCRRRASNFLYQNCSESVASTILSYFGLLIDGADIHMDVVPYCVLAFFVVGTAYIVKDPNIGVLYLASSFSQAFAMAMLLFDLCHRGDASNYSVYSLSLSALGMFSRVRAMTGGAYIPLDPLGGNMFFSSQIFICLEFAMVIPACWYLGPAKEMVSRKSVFAVVFGIAMIAYFMHPDLDEVYEHLNILWCFGKYIESIDMWPFLAKAVEKPTINDVAANYVFCMFLSRVFVGLVFFTCYEEFHHKDNAFVGYGLLSGHIMALILCAGVVVHYFKFFGKEPEVMVMQGIAMNFK